MVASFYSQPFRTYKRRRGRRVPEALEGRLLDPNRRGQGQGALGVSEQGRQGPQARDDGRRGQGQKGLPGRVQDRPLAAGRRVSEAGLPSGQGWERDP
jgi:hypothetical protein